MKTLLLLVAFALSVLAQSVTIGAPVFGGTGLNDASAGGAFITFPANAEYVATISATGTPDHFTWTKNGGSASSPVAITGGTCLLPALVGSRGWQALADGVDICWLAGTGHTLAVSWTITAQASGSSIGQTSIALGPGAVFRPQQSINRDRINIRDFGAKLDGVTPDDAAWAFAFNATQNASLYPNGATVHFPAGRSLISSGVTFAPSGANGFLIDGDGPLSSVFTFTGITAITWAGSTNSSDSGMKNCGIQDPIGNASSLGLLVGGGSLGNSRLLFDTVDVLGNPSNRPTGSIAIKIANSVLPNFDHVVAAQFDTGVLQTGFVNSHWHQSFIGVNATRGWDIESSGDSSMSQSDIEGNGSDGLYIGTLAENITVMQTHFEGNTTNQFHGVAGELFTWGNTYAAGSLLVDGTNLWTSYSDQIDSAALTNNSIGGGGIAGATLIYPLLLGTTSGTGCTVVISLSAQTAGCGALPYMLSGYQHYIVDSYLEASASSALGYGAQIFASDPNPLTSNACIALVPTGLYPSVLPKICWNSANGGFTFQPGYAPGGATNNDYSFANAAGSPVLYIQDNADATFFGTVASLGGFYVDAGAHYLDSSGNLNVASCTGCGGGVTSLAGGTEITVSASTGAITINNTAPFPGGATITYSGVPTGCTFTGGVPSACTNSTLIFTNGLK